MTNLQTRYLELNGALTADDKTRTVDAVLSTGEAVRRVDADGEYMEVLSMAPDAVRLARLNKGAPLLDSHNYRDGVRAILGSITPGSARIEDGSLIARLKFSGSAAGRRVFEDVKTGAIRNLSIGYLAHTVTIDDEQDPPIRTVVDWEPHEASVVAIPADAGAQFRSFEKEESSMKVDNAVLAERERATAIESLGSRLDAQQEFVREHIKRGTTVEAFRSELIDHMAAKQPRIDGVSQIDVMRDEGDTLRDGVENALFSRLSGTAPEGAGREYASRTLAQLAGAFLEARGERTRLLTAGELIQRGGMHTTSDFPVALSAAAQRYLRTQFQTAETGASAIVQLGTARDFRAQTEVQISGFPTLSKVLESGEITFGSLTESGESITIASYARGLRVSFQALTNDDLGAIERGMRDIAFAAADLKASLIMNALSANMADGLSLFHSTHNNLAGSGTAITVAALSAGRQSIRVQKRLGANVAMGLSPAILLCGPAKETEAEQILAPLVPAQSSNVNPFSGQLRLAIEPRIADNAWYLFAAPGTYPVARFLTLEAFEAPRVESEPGFDTLSLALRVVWHCGAGPVDYRGAYKNAGA